MRGIREGVPTRVRKYAEEQVRYWKDVVEKKLMARL